MRDVKSNRRKTPGEILTYNEMVVIENFHMQKGMNFRTKTHDTVVLMSRQKHAMYEDSIDIEGNIVYEGHDTLQKKNGPSSKLFDQEYLTKTGKLTENGKFADAIDSAKINGIEKVYVYEKLIKGNWLYKGKFNLHSYTYDAVQNRKVFKFLLKLSL